MTNSLYQNFENSTPFLRGYSTLKIPIVDADGAPVWPELFPLEKIDEMRETVGPRHFSSQMMLEFIDAERIRLDPGSLRLYSGEFDARIGKLLVNTLASNLITGVACYWDPSGGRVGSDASVIVLVYRDDKNRRAFIHDMKYLKVDDNDLHPLSTQCATVLDFMVSHDMRHIAIEVNGMGSALPEVLRDVAIRRGQSVIVQKIVNHRRKETRILDAIEPLLSAGRLFIHERIRDTPLLMEMIGWSPAATGGHDDGLDAIAGALRLQPIPVRPLGQTLRPMMANTNFKI